MSFLMDMMYAAGMVVSSPFWGYRLLRTGKWRTDWPGRFGRTSVKPEDRPTLLIHAVSVGEVNATRQLIQKLEARHGQKLRIVICTTTDTGNATARKLFEPRHAVARYPLDFSWCVRKFLDSVRPDMVALMELELWPNFASACTRRGIPLAVINGRLSERSAGRYRLVRPMIGRAFRSLAAAAVQDEDYAGRFEMMGTARDRIRVTGTMKWDTAQIADQVPGSRELAEVMGIDPSRPLIVCGSSGPGEEKLFMDQLGGLEALDGAGARVPVQLLIAPRKPERFEEAAAAMPGAVRRSQSPDGTARPVGKNRIFLLDSLGDLRKAYALATVVVVGRSFCPLYGSDMIEPIALGKPTVIGPNTKDFQDTMRSFLKGNGIIQLAEGGALGPAVSDLLQNPAQAAALAARGRQVIREQQGATDRHVELIESLLCDRLK